MRLLALCWFAGIASGIASERPSVVVDTGQVDCFDATRPIAAPKPGKPFFGQDAQYTGAQPAYRDNGDGTVTDLNTGLVWSKAVEEQKVTLKEAGKIAEGMTLAGHNDWRVPTIKELYSLIDFRGVTGMAAPKTSTAPASAIPYINTDYFDFRYGGPGERFIDAQWLTQTKYTSTTMGGAQTLFGVNFADGRIKGYPMSSPDPRRPTKKFYARYVRGPAYGENEFRDNGDGTVSDLSTGLMWAEADSGAGMDWETALRFAEDFELAGHSDWRLPNAKELQSLVDYTRSPDGSNSPAIDPIFLTTPITNEAGQHDWPFFWTSTTHQDGPDSSNAVYVAFGRAIGEMHGKIMDVHGAGAQRSDPKAGKAALGHGPQGDAQRVLNYVRCVRGGAAPADGKPAKPDPSRYPATIRVAGVESRPKQVDPTSRPAGPPAQGSRTPPAGAPLGNRGGFVSRLDKDGDGKVSRREFDGPPERFDFHDANRDGYLTESEAPPIPPR